MEHFNQRFLAATKQLYERFCPSVPSVTSFSQCSWHRIIMEVLAIITVDKNHIHAKGQGRRSKVKVTEVKNKFCHILDISGIHRWLGNDAQSLKWHRRGVLFFLRSSVKLQGDTGRKIDDLAPTDLSVSNLNSRMAMKWHT